MNHILLEEVESTNDYVSLHAGDFTEDTMVRARRQTAGRGQRGNVWESEPGANLTFTLFHHPEEVEAIDQYAISEASALAVTDLLADFGVTSTVKWPNDIYVGNRKICGILIECAVMGKRIEHCRIGAGININQTRFVGDAPNPVSLAMLGIQRQDIDEVARKMGSCLERRLVQTSPRLRAALHREYLSRLWRNDGKPYPYRRRDTGVHFDAVITDVSPRGPITLRNVADGREETFWFKEIEALLQ